MHRFAVATQHPLSPDLQRHAQLHVADAAQLGRAKVEAVVSRHGGAALAVAAGQRQGAHDFHRLLHHLCFEGREEQWG